MGNFTIFESAVSALGTASQALSVAGQNIANVNTPGYSRQRAVLNSTQPQVIGGIELGRGVEVRQIQRVFDAFAELRLRDAAGQQKETSITASSLNQLEEIFNETGRDGLSTYMTDFFNSFNDLSSDPESVTARQNVLNKAGIMIGQFQKLSESLRNSRDLIDQQIKGTVNQVNYLSAEIYDLNSRIQQSSGDALTLKDERNLRVKELSELIDVTAIENTDGNYQVYTAGGLLLISNKEYATLSTISDSSNDGLVDIRFTVGSGAPSNVTDRISKGALKGLLDVRDVYIPSYQASLDELAYQVVKEVNDLHTSGYDLDGNALNEFFDDNAFATQAAITSDLATELKNGAGQHLRVRVGDVISFTGSVGGTAMSGQSLTVTSSTTLDDIENALQAALRSVADGTLTETAVIQADGSIQVTSDATHAITNLQLSISGNSLFNTAFTYSTPIAAGGATASSDTIEVVDLSDAASLISLDAAVDGLPRGIVAASDPLTLPGGNDIALSLAGLQNASITFSSGSTKIGGFYGDLLARVGSDSSSKNKSAEFASSILRQAESQRETISGVSIDDEQIDLIRFQAAFSAASRLVSVANELLQKLVTLTE